MFSEKERQVEKIWWKANYFFNNIKSKKLNPENIKDIKNIIVNYIDIIFKINNRFNTNLFGKEREKIYNTIVHEIYAFSCNIFTASDSTELSNSINLLLNSLRGPKLLEPIANILEKFESYLNNLSAQARLEARGLISRFVNNIKPQIISLNSEVLRLKNIAIFISKFINILGELREWSLKYIYQGDVESFEDSNLSCFILTIQNLTNTIRLEGNDRLMAELRVLTNIRSYFGKYPINIDGIKEELTFKKFDLYEDIMSDIVAFYYKMLDFIYNREISASKINNNAKQPTHLDVAHNKKYAKDSSDAENILKEVKKFRKKVPTSDYEVKRGYVNCGDIINDSGFISKLEKANPLSLIRDLSHSMQLGKIIMNSGRVALKDLVVFKGFGTKYLGEKYSLFNYSKACLSQLQSWYENNEFRKIVFYLNRYPPEFLPLPIFISTTTDVAMARSFGKLILKINIPESGKKFLDLHDECFDQKEILLPKFSKFKFNRACMSGRVPIIDVDLLH